MATDFAQGELVWLDFTPQAGHEQAGRRPALVVSRKVYNRESSFLLVCPITTNDTPWGWKVPLPAALEVKGYVLVDQVKSVDAAARHVRGTGAAVGEAVLADVLHRLGLLFELSPAPI